VLNNLKKFKKRARKYALSGLKVFMCRQNQAFVDLKLEGGSERVERMEIVSTGRQPRVLEERY